MVGKMLLLKINKKYVFSDMFFENINLWSELTLPDILSRGKHQSQLWECVQAKKD